MSTDSPERPETISVPGRWPSPVARSHLVVAAVLLLLVLAFAGAWAIGGDAFLLASSVSAVVVIGALPVVVLAPLVRGVRGRVRVERHGRALSFPGTPVERPLYAVVAVLAALLPLTLRWDAARTGTEVSSQFLVWSWAAVPFGLYGLLWVARTYVRPQVELSASGVRLVATGQDSALLWEDLPPLDRQNRPRLVSALRELGVPPHAATLVLSDPEVLARLVELYRTRPDLRHELATGATLDRLRQGDFEAATTRTD